MFLSTGLATGLLSTGDYWIVKNSWGDVWQDHGFIYIARGVPGGCGRIFGSGAHVYTMGDPEFYYE